MSDLKQASLQVLEGMKRLVADIAAQTPSGDRPATMAAVVQAFALMRIADALEQLATPASEGTALALRAQFARHELAVEQLVDEPPDRTERIEIRCTPAEQAWFQRSAQQQGLTLSAFMRIAARKVADP